MQIRRTLAIAMIIAVPLMLGAVANWNPWTEATSPEITFVVPAGKSLEFEVSALSTLDQRIVMTEKRKGLSDVTRVLPEKAQSFSLPASAKEYTVTLKGEHKHQGKWNPSNGRSRWSKQHDQFHAQYDDRAHDQSFDDIQVKFTLK